MNKTVQDEIDRLTQDLQQLSIQKESIDRTYKRVSKRIEQLRRRQSVNTQHISREATQINTRRTDADGNLLQVGDKVSFITKGKFKSTEGVVTSFGKRFVSTVDDEGRIINRESRNLRRITAKDQHIDNHDRRKQH